MSDDERRQWLSRAEQLGRDWITAAEAVDVSADSPAAQELARRHVEWLRGIPGTPAAEPGGNVKTYVLALAEVYVGDERFAANYGGAVGAAFVRDALSAYVESLP
jgi:hypothetical protein